MYKRIMLYVIACCLGNSLLAQEWQTDMEKAMNVASIQNQKIVLVFQGSDWCGPCIKLNKEIWSKEEFKNYAKDNFVMLKAEFPRKKKNSLPKEQIIKNNQLAEKYNKRGIFPLVVIMDSNGRVLGQTGYKKLPVKEYIALINSFKG